LANKKFPVKEYMKLIHKKIVREADKGLSVVRWDIPHKMNEKLLDKIKVQLKEDGYWYCHNRDIITDGSLEIYWNQ